MSPSSHSPLRTPSIIIINPRRYHQTEIRLVRLVHSRKGCCCCCCCCSSTSPPHRSSDHRNNSTTNDDDDDTNTKDTAATNSSAMDSVSCGRLWDHSWGRSVRRSLLCGLHTIQRSASYWWSLSCCCGYSGAAGGSPSSSTYVVSYIDAC